MKHKTAERTSSAPSPSYNTAVMVERELWIRAEYIRRSEARPLRRRTTLDVPKFFISFSRFRSPMEIVR